MVNAKLKSMPVQSLWRPGETGCAPTADGKKLYAELVFHFLKSQTEKAGLKIAASQLDKLGGLACRQFLAEYVTRCPSEALRLGVYDWTALLAALQPSTGGNLSALVSTHRISLELERGEARRFKLVGLSACWPHTAAPNSPSG